MDNKETDLDKFLIGNKNKPHEPKNQTVTVKEEKKKGRPTNKDKDKDYVRYTVRIPEELREEIKLALLTSHKHLQHKTQDAFTEAAIRFYLDKKKEKS